MCRPRRFADLCHKVTIPLGRLARSPQSLDCVQCSERFVETGRFRDFVPVAVVVRARNTPQPLWSQAIVQERAKRIRRLAERTACRSMVTTTPASR